MADQQLAQLKKKYEELALFIFNQIEQTITELLDERKLLQQKGKAGITMLHVNKKAEAIALKAKIALSADIQQRYDAALQQFDALLNKATILEHQEEHAVKTILQRLDTEIAELQALASQVTAAHQTRPALYNLNTNELYSKIMLVHNAITKQQEHEQKFRAARQEFEQELGQKIHEIEAILSEKAIATIATPVVQGNTITTSQGSVQPLAIAPGGQSGVIGHDEKDSVVQTVKIDLNNLEHADNIIQFQRSDREVRKAFQVLEKKRMEGQLLKAKKAIKAVTTKINMYGPKYNSGEYKLAFMTNVVDQYMEYMYGVLYSYLLHVDEASEFIATLYSRLETIESTKLTKFQKEKAAIIAHLVKIAGETDDKRPGNLGKKGKIPRELPAKIDSYVTNELKILEQDTPPGRIQVDIDRLQLLILQLEKKLKKAMHLAEQRIKASYFAWTKRGYQGAVGHLNALNILVDEKIRLVKQMMDIEQQISTKLENHIFNYLNDNKKLKDLQKLLRKIHLGEI